MAFFYVFTNRDNCANTEGRMTYSTLQSDIASYLHRADLTAQIPTFIRLAEANISRELSIPETEISVDGVTIGGYAVLPTDFASLTKLSITYGGAARVLDYIALAQVSTSTEANPGYYTFENGKLRIYGSSDGQTYTLYYIPKVSNLSDVITTNWILDNAPDLYLYASALEGARYIKDAEEEIRLKGIVDTLIDSLRRQSERKGQPSSGILQIKVRR